ncbi:molybdopterin-synthase adenylyltransferase MoeB [Paracoccus sp. 11-3]|uniref:Molybdopterin-synthase adenylyltransferase n=1 Tax=Paracoccus amoyensis TaxID=2760093 RepID=A0A926G6B3_9RHOB|nr:molybdopterin-synthase adenylyltransferase MoeB [Paracoccus amoyensis]MBC9245358.1 molybdopterin-synthase adenylyltransferase MoeB [Paracoccus amoyensis]
MLGLLFLIGAALTSWVFGLSRLMTWLVLGVVWLAFIPISGQLGRLGGDSLQGWMVLGFLGLAVFLYQSGLRWIRGHVGPIEPETGETTAEAQAIPPGLSDPEIDRYARHLVLREIGGPGQMRLRDARVLVVGAGGLGAPICLYLAAAGIGHITVIDGDTVSLSNLQRQVIFRSDQQGQMKAAAAAANMAALNPHIAVEPVARALTEDDGSLIAAHDLVLDGTDDFETRSLVNRLCVRAKVPLLAGAIAQWEGQVTLYDPAHGGPCLSCLFPEPPARGLAPACAEAGVVGALPGVIGSQMALEAIKHLTGAGLGLRGRLLVYDGLYGETRMIGIEKRGDCPVCGSPLEAGPKAS